MNILLTHAYFIAEDAAEQRIMRPYVPLGLLYISAWLEQHGEQHEVFDSTFSNVHQQQVRLMSCIPDIIGIYTNLMTRANVIRLVTWMRSQTAFAHTWIVLGGPEVRHHAEGLLDLGADIVVVGEGEQTFLEIVRHRKLGESLDSLGHIHGLVFRNQGKTIETPARTLMRELDLLPLPNRKKVDISLYTKAWKERHGYSMISVSTMRGCPYTCKWCSRAVYGGTYRRRAPALVAKELRFIRETYAPDMVWFVDDVFTISHKWLAEFVHQVKLQDAIIPYEIITRADRMNEQVVHLLKESGCARIWIGAESGSQRIIDAMDRRVDVAKVQEMIRLCAKNRISTGTFIMLGYPGETLADIRATIHHLVVSNPDHFTLTIAYPIKGTPLYDEVKENITAYPDPETGSDRDIEFRRTYPRRFYEWGVRYVNHAVMASRNSGWKQVKHRARAAAALGAMLLNRAGLRI